MPGADENGAEGLGRRFAALVDTGAGAGDGHGEKRRLDFERLARDLAKAADPLADLAGLAASIRADEGATALERRLAERLGEAGVGTGDVEMPSVRVVRPRTSGLFYLRIDDEELSYLAKRRILAAEAALNGALLCSALLPDAESASEEDVVKAEQRVARSIVSQAAEPLLDLEGEPTRGEWHDRHAIAGGIECLRLPYRLQARFRLNARAGACAIEVDLAEPALMPGRAYVDGVGVVPATAVMRRRAATDYNLRLVVLMAAYAFAATEDLEEVWVAGVVDTAASHACYCSARFERQDLEGLDLTRIDPVSLLRWVCAELDEEAGELRPVRQGFSLEDELFCPPERFEAPELSGRRLPAAAAEALGCRLVAGMAVDEHAARAEAARLAAERLGDTTAQNVRAVEEAAREVGGADVEEAARRTIRAILAGELDDADPLAVQEAFMGAGPLSEEAAEAQKALLSGDPARGADVLAAALAPFEAEGAFADGPLVVWRAFDSYADRALYNRLVSPLPPESGREVRLAPRAYLESIETLSICDLALGREEAALDLARRAAQIAPLSTQASLQLSSCLEAVGDADGAAEEVRRLLGYADDPQTIGIAYLRMASLQWGRGHMLAAQACVQMAEERLPGQVMQLGLKVAELLGHAGKAERLSPARVLDALAEAGIPAAPTEAVAEALLDAARAACDENLFRIAREALYLVVALTRDDVFHGMLRSLEGEPDR